ncbi:MAG: hypothetical protein E6K16_03990 [Methanobacteriota archaeon]|nr:MAG: hypothetical protein E6K16_03990 [Euryarchaeota archaeon]
MAREAPEPGAARGVHDRARHEPADPEGDRLPPEGAPEGDGPDRRAPDRGVRPRRVRPGAERPVPRGEPPEGAADYREGPHDRGRVPPDPERPAGREAELPIHDRDGLPPDAEREEAGQADGPHHGRRPHPPRGPLDERGHVRGDGRGLDPHGGANETAIRALLAIETPETAEEYVLKTLAAGEKVFGFGHRVYKTWDPRALILQDVAKKLSAETGNEKPFAVAKAVEETMVREVGPKGIYPNVDYWAGIVYYMLGLAPDLFPATFAVARITGWVAHVVEYWEDNRIMRPLDWYVGPKEVVYVPIDQRS